MVAKYNNMNNNNKLYLLTISVDGEVETGPRLIGSGATNRA